jgi:hypothetical protein
LHQVRERGRPLVGHGGWRRSLVWSARW